MCAEKIQRLMMAAMIALASFLLIQASIWGVVLMGFIILMIVVWAITDFCPSIWMLGKIVGHCKKCD